MIFAWLAPITNQEASFVNGRGWSEFAREIEKHEGDLVDFERDSVI